MISEGWIALCRFDDLWPGKMAQAGGFDGEQAAAQGGQVGIDVVVADACAILEHLAVPNPVVADFASGPVSSGQGCEVGGVGSIIQRFVGVIVGQFGFGVVEGGIGAAHDDQRAGSPQSGFRRFYGVNGGRAAIDAPVTCVGFFGVGKKGVVWAIFSAVR